MLPDCLKNIEQMDEIFLGTSPTMLESFSTTTAKRPSQLVGFLLHDSSSSTPPKYPYIYGIPLPQLQLKMTRHTWH